MTTITEIAPDLYRISTFVPESDLQFNQFLAVDDQPLLFHTGMRVLFRTVRDAVARLIDPSTILWIGFSHFEADECGALNEWLGLAPAAEPITSLVGALVSINDFAIRPARPLADGETIETGRRRFRFLQTSHVPHCWDAGLIFEETNGVLLASDLLHQVGNVAATTTSGDVVEAARRALVEYQAGPLANYLPYTAQTGPTIHRLADLRPATIAAMHGSTYIGNGERILRDYAQMLDEVIGSRQVQLTR